MSHKEIKDSLLVGKEEKIENEIGYKVEVRGARHIAPKDPNRASDPYCLLGVADPTSLSFVAHNTPRYSSIISITIHT
jgi:hypothetical protein